MSDKYYFDLLQPTENLDKAMNDLGNTLGVLYQEMWSKYGSKHHDDKPFELNIQAFSSMWFNGSITLFVAYEVGTNKPVGFATGTSFRPMAYNSNVFQVHDWYISDTSAVKDLFDYITGAIRILKCDELWCREYTELPVVLDGWDCKGVMNVKRFAR